MMNPTMPPRPSQGREHGAALITSLIILLILTVLGVSAMSSSSLQELMAGNLRDQSVAFDASEAALRDAEQKINSWPGIRPTAATTAGSNAEVYARLVILDGNGNPCMEGDGCPFDTAIWGNYSALTWGGATTSGLATAYGSGPLSSSTPPLYVIEEVRDITASADYQSQVRRSGITVYRITARGSGLSSNSVSILQSTFGKRFL